jgi:hypothetical protein
MGRRLAHRLAVTADVELRNCIDGRGRRVQQAAVYNKQLSDQQVAWHYAADG